MVVVLTCLALPASTQAQGVVAWGRNLEGECNVVALPIGLTYVEVVAGDTFVTARRSDGSVVAWGSNYYGQCNVPALPPGLAYAEIAPGYWHAVARRSDGSLVAWGANVYGQCNVPALPAGLAYVEVDSSYAHSAGRRSDGSIIAWGRNAAGECDVPVLPADLVYVELATGGSHSLARRSDGSVVAWGDNSFGQCNVPALPIGVTYLGVDAGVDFSLARRSDGTVVAWGRNTFGQCNVPALPAGLAFVTIAAGRSHALAHRSDGTVVAWGYNAHGQCNVPPLSSGLAYVEISAGFGHTVARYEASNAPPVASAGADQALNEGAVTLLDGSGSSDPEGAPLSFTWTQVSGPAVSLANDDTASPSFSAPLVGPGGATLTFQLVVSDGVLTSLADSVDVTVLNVNRAPFANAGDPQTAPEYSFVTLDGTASFDPDGDSLAFVWVQSGGPAVTLSDVTAAQPMFVAPGVSAAGATLTFTLHVGDGFLASTDTVEISVSNVNQPPSVDAGLAQVVNEASLVVLAGTASDVDGDLLTQSWVQVSGPTVTLSEASSLSCSFTAPVVAANVSLVFQLSATDGMASSSSEVVILVRDSNASPECTYARASVEALWPPDHKMIPISIVNLGDQEGASLQVTITSVTQDEPTQGLGDGDTAGDAVIVPGGGVLLRAERDGLGNGRVYFIHFTATDELGQQCSGSVRVTVPHSKKKTTPAVDDGQSFDSMQ